MKPVWYLDVDDVINFHSSKGVPRVWAQPKVGDPATILRSEVLHTPTGQTVTMEWAKPVTDLIASVSDRVEIIMMTSWNLDNQATDVLGPMFGIGTPVNGYTLSGIDLPSPDVPHLKSKEKAVQALSWPGGPLFGRPVIWSDDDLNSRHKSELKSLLHAFDVPALIVSPVPRVGLAPIDLVRITKFIDAHA